MDCAGKVCRDGAFPQQPQTNPSNARKLKPHEPANRSRRNNEPDSGPPAPKASGVAHALKKINFPQAYLALFSVILPSEPKFIPRTFALGTPHWKGFGPLTHHA
jgi:hypothetical protein